MLRCSPEYGRCSPRQLQLRWRGGGGWRQPARRYFWSPRRLPSPSCSIRASTGTWCCRLTPIAEPWFAIGALGLIGVEMLTGFAGRGTGDTENLAWRFGFVAALLVNLKQANPVLLALVTGGLAVVALRDPAIEKRRALAQLPRMLGPAIIVFVMWRWYVMTNVPHGDVAFRSFDAWNFALLPTVFAAIWGHITDAPLFHAMMWIVTAAGFAAFFTLPRKVSEARGLAVVCATVSLGYNPFLLGVCLGAMTSPRADTPAQYSRYPPHLALLPPHAPPMP